MRLVISGYIFAGQMCVHLFQRTYHYLLDAFGRQCLASI